MVVSSVWCAYGPGFQHLHLVEPTHFVSIPLRSVQLAERVEELMETLHKDYGIDTSLYMPVKKLHLTLQVCKLFSEEQLRPECFFQEGMNCGRNH